MNEASDMVIMLADDKSRVRIAMLDGEGNPLAYRDFDAPALQNLITIFARNRAQLADAVIPEFDPGKVTIDVEDDVSGYVGSEGPFSKRFIMALRHPGYGWLGFRWSERAGRRVAERMMMELLRIDNLPTGLLDAKGRKL